MEIIGSRFIPAYTGNAEFDIASKALEAVYPRVYGECLNIRRNALLPTGLSPRIRGMLLMNIIVSKGIFHPFKIHQVFHDHFNFLKSYNLLLFNR